MNDLITPRPWRDAFPYQWGHFLHQSLADLDELMFLLKSQYEIRE